MKVVVPLGLIALARPVDAADKQNPISRVTELLGGLAEKVEMDMKKEEDLYEEYVCWGKTVIESKTETNAKAKSRIDMLESYIEDLEAGRVELTSERTDLVKEIAGLNSDLEMAKNEREQEKSDYDAAKDEMNKAIDALDEAVKILKEATKGSLLEKHKSDSLLGMKTNTGFSARSQQANSLTHALSIGRRYLSAGDTLFLERLLSGDVNSPNWKKLNRKATFKMSYKKRSGEIQDVLKKLKKDFESNLEDADKRETKAVEDYDKLKASKETLLETAENALKTMAGEGGANGLSKTEAEDEVGDLKQQRTDDKKYMKETEADLKDMKEQWKTRKELMVGEIAAINKAKAILSSDDARDTMKKSFSLAQKKTVSFLQIRSGRRSIAAQKIGSALEVVRAAERGTKDSRLNMLASLMQLTKPGQFDKVIAKIEKMITVIEKEATADEEKKTECETDRKTNTAEAKSTSNALDDLTDKMDALEKEIKDLNEEIKEKEEEIDTLQKELKEAKKIREEEKEAWEANDAADKMASELVESSKEVLTNFYKENNLNLVQRNKRMDPVKAGEAPPPPPKTWEGDYKGATEESNGIVGILEKIKEEIDTDRADAKTAEDDAQKDFDTLESDTETSIGDLNSAIEDLTTSVSDKEDTIASDKEEAGTKKDELKTTLGILKEDQPGCDYITVNFKLREKNREIETEGLTKAKEILEGENK